jgi:hypothetical protein
MPTFPKTISGPKVVKPSSIGPSLTTNKVTTNQNNNPIMRASVFKG